MEANREDDGQSNARTSTSIESPPWIDSGIYEPLYSDWYNISPEESVRSLSDSEAEDFNDRLEDYGRELWFLKLAMAILMALILGLISGVLWIIFTLNGYGTR